MEIRSGGGRRLVNKLQLIELPTTSLEGKKDLVSDYKDAFPIIGTPVFSLKLKKVFSIVENGVEKGLVFNHRLTGKFSKFGNYDYSILIFKEYQAMGLGRKTTALILSKDKKAVFIVPNKNQHSLALFKSFTNLKKFKGEKFNVYINSIVSRS
jgi:hypothetical protein